MKFNIMRNQLRRIIFTVALVQSLSKTFDKLTALLASIPSSSSSSTFNYSQRQARDPEKSGNDAQDHNRWKTFCSSLSKNASSSHEPLVNLLSIYSLQRRYNAERAEERGREREREREKECVFRTFIFCSRIDTRVRSNLFRNREPEKHKHRPINQTDIKNCY